MLSRHDQPHPSSLIPLIQMYFTTHQSQSALGKLSQIIPCCSGITVAPLIWFSCHWSRFSMSRSPLENASHYQLRQLCQTLWSWTLCNDCSGLHHCQNDGCPGQRFMRLTRFFNYYNSLGTLCEPDVSSGELAALYSTVYATTVRS